jgi:thiol:disulfide interchange protein DsbC
MPTVVLFLSFIFFFPVTDAYTFATKDQNCSKCHHALKKDEATSFLKNFDQNIKVLDVKQSPVKYLWEVSFESKGQKGMVYIDLPKKHIISGSLFTIEGRKNLTQDRLSEINRVNVSQIPLKDALIMGNQNAKHKVIVFDDPE